MLARATRFCAERWVSGGMLASYGDPVPLKGRDAMIRSAAAIVALMMCGVTTAATINVAPGESINDAISTASNGDVIVLSAGTYNEDSQVDTSGKAITIRGIADNDGDGLPETILDGGNSHRVLICQSGETSATIFEDLVITGAGNISDGSGGGGLFCTLNSSPTLRNCVIDGNNSSPFDGGGLLCHTNSSPTLIDCYISNNTAVTGAGIFMYYSSPTLTGCVIQNNSATLAYGGGVGVTNNCYPIFTECIIRSNHCVVTQSWGGGAGIHVRGYPHHPLATLNSCVIEDNHIENGNGGGIYLERGNYIALSDCIVRGNTSTGTGGGIYVEQGPATVLTNSSICNNLPDQIDGDYAYDEGTCVDQTCDNCDVDGDGVPDGEDAFPNDPDEWTDTDGDGVGDNGDACPNDADNDTDGDGVCGDVDAFPDDPSEWADFDSDGVGDNSDAFPNDPNEWADSDGDGVGDNGDAFPDDPDEWTDTDGDGIGDNEDTAPHGPCCVGTGCHNTAASACASLGGTWLGEDGSCDDCPAACAGDITGDGQLGIHDLLLMLENWGPCP